MNYITYLNSNIKHPFKSLKIEILNEVVLIILLHSQYVFKNQTSSSILGSAPAISTKYSASTI